MRFASPIFEWSDKETMKRKIILVRHAKSAWDIPGITDLDRPLKQRGIRDAKVMGKQSLRLLDLPDLLVTSHAKRALMTSAIFLDELNLDESHRQIEPLLYHATPEQILRVISNLPDRFASVMLFGHNPGFTDFANWFSPESIDNIPTTGLVVLESSAQSWKDFQTRNTTLTEFIFPKQFIEY